jgi:hypothetical protein
MKKVFVDVIVRYPKEGQIIPLSLIWADGSRYEIDTIIDIRKAASMIAGGVGMRYTCRIQGHERYLFYEVNENKWFVEGK